MFWGNEANPGPIFVTAEVQNNLVKLHDSLGEKEVRQGN